MAKVAESLDNDDKIAGSQEGRGATGSHRHLGVFSVSTFNSTHI